MKKKFKETKGITLIALVLTIIVLLILAGVTVATLTGDNGILSQAQNAKKVTEYSAAEEKVKVEVMGSYGTNGNLELSKLVENLGHVGTVTKATFPVEVTVDGKSFTISATGAVEKSGPRPTVTSVTVTLENGDEVPEEKVEEGTVLKINLTANIEGGTITSISPSVPYTTNGTEKSKTFTITGSADGESYSIEYTVQLSEYYVLPNPEAGKTTITKNRTLSGSTNTSKMTYKNPVIPQGFSAIDTTAAKWQYEDETTLDEVKGWNNGLVIKDDLDNEFVWVPCTTGTSDEVVTYSKNIDYPKDPGMASLEDVTNAIPVTESTQIEIYGGFYVARYESGLDSATNDPSETTHVNNNYNSTPVSKYGSKIWNDIDFDHSFYVAKKMIKNSTIYGNNKSGLITGTQWDTIMKWLERSNIGVGGTIGTQNWGTYKTIDYGNTGYYFIYGNSVGNWINGTFSHSAYEFNTSINDSNPAHFHASGLNTNKGYQKNIADLAGNVSEWTSELYTYIYDNENRIAYITRGGNSQCSGIDNPASMSSQPACWRRGLSNRTSFGIGFRVVLYIQETE